MRDYPPPAEYEKMLSSPQGIRIAFKDKSLHVADIEKTAIGLPRARAGAFAVVYRAIMPNRSSCAVRLFLKDGDDRQDRYQLVSDHLNRQKLPCLVPFTYTADSFRAADGSWYPMMTMEWVKGETLFDWLQARATSGDQKAIRSVADKWRTVVKDLHSAQIAHGDLQHANIMVTEAGELKLVDYDGMCVPNLVGRPNLEIGVCPYQHPERDGNTKLSLTLDNFSALFIYVGLRAVAADPRLWQDFVVQADYDKMLFRREDIADPLHSALFQRLRRSPDGDVQRLATSLTDLARVRLDQVPFLEELLFSWDQVRGTIGAAEFRRAIALLSRNKKRVSDAPPDLQPAIREAEQRIAKLDELIAAVQAGDEQQMAAAVDSPLLRGFPEAAETVTAAKDAPTVIAAIEKIERARRAAQWREFVRTWDASQAVFKRPKGSLRRSVTALAGEVEAWRKRNALCDELQAALRAASPDPSLVADTWKRLDDLGGHPECETFRADIDKTVARGRAWSTFRNVPASVSEQHDRALVAAWNETEFLGWPPAEAERPRLEQAVIRLRACGEATKAASAQLTKVGEEHLLSFATTLPKGYSPEVTARIEVARNRLKALADLASAMAADSDQAVATAYNTITKSQAQSLVDPAVSSRVKVALGREKALDALGSIPASYTAAQATQWDRRLLAAWSDSLLGDCKDAAPWAVAASNAKKRHALLSDLAEAVRTCDPFRAFDINDHPLVKGYAHAPDVQKFLTDATHDVGSIRSMLDAFGRGDRSGFVQSFSARVIREHAPAFEKHWQTLIDWTEAEVLQTHKLGLLLPVGVKPIETVGGAGNGPLRVVFRWKWPEPRFTEDCRVVLCRSRPDPAASPEDTPCLFRISKTRELYQSAGGYHAQQVDPAWKGCYVVVWARLDLGATTLWSEPLLLGKV